MSTLRNITLNFELGQTILVGPNRKPATITKIEYHDRTGEIVLNTTQGPRRALTFALCDSDPEREAEINPADRYR